MELERVFRQQFYDREKSEWKHSDLKLTVLCAKKQQRGRVMDTSA
jgi:hypothetical protein